MIKKWILHEFLKKNKWKYALGIAALVTSSLLQLTVPKMLGYIIDCLENRTAAQSTVVKWTLIMFLVSALLFCMKYIFRYFIVGGARDIECFLRAKLFAHLQTLPSKFFNNRKTGDLMSYATNDLNVLKRAFSFGVIFLVDGVIINLTSFVVMVETINPLLTIAALVPIIASVIIITRVRKSIWDRFTEVQQAFSDISDKVQENISGIRVVKAYVQEEHEIGKMSMASKLRMDAQMKYIKLSAILQPTIKVCFGISYTVVLIMGSRYVSQGKISLGDFVAFNTYLSMLALPITRMGKIVEIWQKAMASIRRLDDIFLVKTDIVDENPSFSDNRFHGDISIRNLTFAYPGSTRQVLRNIDFDIEGGKTLAIIGKTGSGKTTIANLLLRLFKVDRGQIFIDGVDVNDIPLTTLRNSIGYVPQDNFLFSASIKDNIQFFADGYSDEDVEEVARISDVYDDIVDFPDGFETVVGERGVALSGGQKQRISIARAIIKDPSVLILDDSLSAVDTKTEEKILASIKEVLKDRTGIIIAHRISTIKHADEIVLMDKGRIVERGTHEKLLDMKGQYYRLYCTQAAENSIKSQKEVAI